MTSKTSRKVPIYSERDSNAEAVKQSWTDLDSKYSYAKDSEASTPDPPFHQGPCDIVLPSQLKWLFSGGLSHVIR